MRKLFSRQLVEARHEMLSIYEAIDLALHDAVKAYVTDDRKLATKTKKRTLTIDARCANLEAVCYNLIATQSPVASDFRLLQTIIYIDFNLQRMNDKVRAVTRAAKRKIKGEFEVPQELIDLIKKQAEAGDRFAPDTLPANAPHAEFVKATDAMNERLDALDLNEVEIEEIEEPKE